MRRWLVVSSAFLFLLGLLFTNSPRYSPTTLNSDLPVRQTGQETEKAEAAEKKTTKSDSLGESDGVLVTRVVDGDTIEIEGGQKVRYIGINTPETVDPRATVECFGREASSKNKKLVENKRVRLEKDVSDTDKYGRLLRYIFINDVLINKALVKEGYAYSSAYPPDIKYQDRFDKAQSEAQAAGKGLWGSCSSGSVYSVETQDGCDIKGNVSSSGKIYHLPGQKYYNSTVIDESKGERWFCSESEAQDAGWRKSNV